MKDLNFFSSYSKKKDRSLNKERIFNFTLVLSVFAMLGYGINNFVVIKKLNGDINKVVKKIEEKNEDKKVKDLKQKEMEISDFKANLTKLKILDDYITKRDIVNEDLLDDIENNLPTKVFLKSIDLNHDAVRIFGKSQDKESISQFEHNLNELGVFGQVFIPQIIQYEDHLDFSMDIKFKEEKSNGAEAGK